MALEPPAKLSNSNTPAGAVPEDGLGLGDGVAEELARLLAAVEAHPLVGDALGVGGGAGLGVLVKLVGGDVVDGENELDVCECHATADDERVNLVEHVVDELDLVRHLGTAEDGQEGTLGALERLGEELKLLLHQETGGTLGQLDADHGRVGTVGSAEGVVDVDVTELGEAGAELLHLGGVGLDLFAGLVGALALLLDVVAEVLEQEDLAALGSGDGLLGGRADTVGQELDVLGEQLGDLGGDGLERVLGDGLAVGAAHVGHEDDCLGLLLDGVLDGGERSDDALVVGDLVAVHGDVEVDADQDLLVLEVDIGDTKLAGERHCGDVIVYRVVVVEKVGMRW
ncbi:hypothetical protein L1887_51565 [Cichorium endivia]|nr:hypothetical protein L1887_51565 [Cichorium endivia]